MVGRMDIDGTRRGEIFFARTTVVLGQIGTRTTIHGVAIVDGWAMAHQWRTHGRKMFRPYTCGALLHRVCATIYGVAMFDGWANGHRWHT